ncbi:hypothetical protein [Fredinandcohnia quinoae]|uniref:Uncharacterized protein n=1 Tax=Fredinandcohnia quinoae TaxID=2918902 RepID=A0AAW5E6Q6_9BACI|nr:hypothetical protein [Fredinandcohnia sp. SECRCQ15]MCH1625671.1 hypothetical protein [Fredinandcohnia sp. SECRCQ15]
MPYESKIRTYNPDRVTKNTTISQSLLQNIKLLAEKLDKPYNSLIEEGIDYVLITYKKQKDLIPPAKPLDRKQLGTTFSEVQYNQLKDRAKKLKTQTNTLIEIGMNYVLENRKENK